jgi:hypothetical protein
MTVEVRYGGRRWALTPGRPLTFGRDPDRDIRLGWQPEDRLVSRRAGALFVVDQTVHVRNDSSSREMYLIPVPGRELRVRPGMTAGLRDPTLHLVLLGRHGARYEIVVRSLADAAAEVGSPTTVAPGLPTATGASAIAPRELRMLTALCEPVLLFAGDEARPATYAAIGKRLKVGPEYVRRCLGDLRERLATEGGVPRLRDERAADGADYREELAVWALDSGTVTTASLDLLDGTP